MRPASALTLALALALATPAAPRAETAVVLPATGVNVSAETLAGAQDVLFGHLLATRRWAVKPLPGAAPAGGWTPTAAAERAREAGADVAVALHLTRLDATTKARLAAYRAADGRMAWFDEASASRPGELDGALRRLAQGFAEGRPAADVEAPREAARPQPPAYPQSAPPAYAHPQPPAYGPPPYGQPAPAPYARPAPPPYAQQVPPPPGAYPPPGQPPPPADLSPAFRKRAGQSFGLAFMGAWAAGPDSVRQGDSSAQGVEAFWLYDTRMLLATVQLSYLGGANHQTAFGMGVYAPLVPGDVAPYLGGGLEFTWSRWWNADSWEEGFTPTLGAGLLLGREWSVQVRAQVGWFYNLYLSSNAGGSFHGQGFTASIGMAY